MNKLITVSGQSMGREIFARKRMKDRRRLGGRNSCFEQLDARQALDGQGLADTELPDGALLPPMEVAGATGGSVPVAKIDPLPEFLAPKPDLAQFAEALSNAGVKMFGAWWCPHCSNQKALFGAAAALLPYIECSNPDGTQNQTGISNNITSYPTWQFQDGGRVAREMTLAELSFRSGIAIPQTSSLQLFDEAFTVFRTVFNTAVTDHPSDFNSNGKLDLVDFCMLKDIGQEHGLLGNPNTPVPTIEDCGCGAPAAMHDDVNFAIALQAAGLDADEPASPFDPMWGPSP